MKNCINCGAPIDFRGMELKCPYCGTFYADEMIVEVVPLIDRPHRDRDGQLHRDRHCVVKKQVTWWETL